MRFKRGSKVEVIASTEGPCVEFRCAEIISGNGHTYSVQYERSGLTRETSVERVPRKAIRPCPPRIQVVGSWQAYDIVEVYEAGSWKNATVLRSVGGDFYLVRLLLYCKTLKVHKTSMRVRQHWINGQWLVKQPGLGNLGVGKSSRNSISNSDTDMVMPEVQQSGSGICRQTSSTRLKRVSLYRYSPNEAYPRKLRAVMNNGECERFKVVSAAPMLEKVDAIAYPQNNMGEKCMNTSVTNGNNQYYETWKENPSNVATHILERIDRPDYSCSVLSSVGSCSVISSSTEASFNHMLTGPCQDEDTLSSDADSLDVGDVDKGYPNSCEEVVSETHRLELHAYRSTLGVIYASGPLSWEQEELLTNLRISLHISNDEHLMEIKNLVSAGQNF